MSQERYFELYQQFINDKITQEDYQDLMDWVSNEKNDKVLRRYMETLWANEELEVDERPRSWTEFKKRFFKYRAEKRTAKVFSISRIWYYAASIALIVGVAYVVYSYLQPDIIIYQTAYGETKDIHLNDGSLVKLNANSTLEWDADWKRSGKRYARLSGEAFFDVEHTKNNDAFTVVTDDLNVKVLGTTFNVEARHSETDVTLETGKIELDLNRPENNSVAMVPGDRVNFSSTKNSLKKDKVETITKSANWLGGVLRFEDVSVEEMFKEIEDQYGKRLVKVDSSILARRLFTGIPYKDWAVAKQAIELALGVKIEEQNNDLYIK